MWKNFSLLVLALAVMSVGCKDNPTDNSNTYGENLITNGTFKTALTQGGNIEYGTEASPWYATYGSPQIGAGFGCDSTPGYLQMWGNLDLGECAYQNLATPIKKGKTYLLTACARFMDDNPENYTRYARARFVAFNTMPLNMNFHWKDNHPQVAVIGTLKTDKTEWKEFTVATWTADADYTGFAINAENDVHDNNTANTVSWLKVDNVSLREKTSVAY